jgi:ABC-type transport system involved in multi-copper enzyme maturation permease subunit
MATLAIARMTLREASRRRLLITLAAITLVGVVGCRLVFGRLDTLTNDTGTLLSQADVRNLALQILILVTFTTSFIAAMAAVFTASPAIAGEIESGVALAIVPRPIRRGAIVVGKWLGLALLITAYTAVAAGLDLVALRTGTGFWGPHPVALVAYLAAEGVAIMTLALLLSTRLATMTAGIVAMAAFGLAWTGGVVDNLGISVDNLAIRHIGTLTQLVIPTDGLWRGAVFSMQPAVLAAQPAKPDNPFGVGAPPTGSYLLWVMAWTVAVLVLGVWSFSRREL